MSTKAKIALRALLSLALLSVIIVHVNWREFGEILLDVNLWAVALTLLLNATGVAISAIKWRWFLELHDMPTSFKRLHLLYYVGFFFNNFLPTLVGGDALRVLNTAQNKRYAAALAAVIGERGTGFGTMLLLAGVAGLINLARDVPAGLNWLAVILLVTCAMIMVAIVVLLQMGRQQADTKWARRFRNLSRAIVDSLRNPVVLAKALAISALFHVMLVANAWLFCYAIGLRLDVLALAVLYPVALLAAMLPVSLNGLGVKEGALIVLLGQVGVTTEQALIVAVLSRLFILLASLVGGLVFMTSSAVRVSLIRNPPAASAAANETSRQES